MLRWSYRRRLIDDELLVKCMHQHWRGIARAIVVSIVWIVGLVAIEWLFGDQVWGRVLLILVAVAGLVGWIRFALPPLTRWYAVSYAVTTRRILFRTGLVNQRLETVDLVGVTNPTTERGGLDRLFGTGSIDLGGGKVMRRVPRALKVEKLITQLAANQTKPVLELTRILRGMGYSRLTTR